jgi:CheY-like chemotaxis protein/predicted regulator of Ras-like GTPase activity (Roadblock/LC7/MglB family)
MEEQNILIVDDDVELGSLLARVISDMSDAYNVKAARNVDEAMIQLRRSQTTQRVFDLVITDIKMMGLNGLELLEALKSIAPGIKTIVITAYNSPELAEHAHELNVYAYLTKPFVISEFRQTVRDALEPPSTPQATTQTTAQRKEPEKETVPKLAAAQEAAVKKQLASMRMMTGAVATLLVHTGGNILAIDALEPEAELDALFAALMIAQGTIAQQMIQNLDRGTPIRQSYFGTETYNICTYRIDESHVAAVVFGPAVKEGQVWYYMRDATGELKNALQAKAEQPTTQKKRPRNDVFDMLDQFFPDRTRQPKTTPPPAPVEPVPVQETVIEPTSIQKPVPEPVAVSPAADDEPIEELEIDWNVSTDTDWDSFVADTEQGFGGMSLEEAQNQGLLSQEIVPPLEPEPETADADEQPLDMPPLDEIDWEVSLDTDWDTLVADTDKGLDGISFEEAQKRGLLNDLSNE